MVAPATVSRLERGSILKTLFRAPFDSPVAWVKCDLVATVSFERLDLFRTGRDQEGKRKYLNRKLSEGDFERVKEGILCGLGFR
eukprot:jgi/Tetstr1/460461/TSEL_005720.t1